MKFKKIVFSSPKPPVRYLLTLHLAYYLNKYIKNVIEYARSIVHIHNSKVNLTGTEQVALLYEF